LTRGWSGVRGHDLYPLVLHLHLHLNLVLGLSPGRRRLSSNTERVQQSAFPRSLMPVCGLPGRA